MEVQRILYTDVFSRQSKDGEKELWLLGELSWKKETVAIWSVLTEEFEGKHLPQSSADQGRRNSLVFPLWGSWQFFCLKRQVTEDREAENEDGW